MFAGLRERVVARLPKSRIGRGIAVLVSGTAMAQAISILAMPIVTRLYAPAQMGVMALFLSYFGFWSATLSLRYEYAILIARDDEESHVVHRLSLVVVGIMSILGMPILWILHAAGLLGFGLLPDWASFVVVPILLGYGAFMVYRAWALRAHMIRDVSRATVLRAGTVSAVRVGLGVFAMGVPALFVAQFASSWAAMFGLARRVGRHFASSRPVTIDGAALVEVARSFIQFPLFDAPSTWVNQLAAMLPVPIIASLHGAAAAGWFGMAWAMVGLPNGQIGNAVADVFQMELADAWVARDVARARTLFYSLLRKLAVLGLVPMVGVVLLGPPLAKYVLGGGWAEVGSIAACIAPWLYAALVVSTLSRLVSVLQVQQYKLAYDVVAAVLTVAAYVAAKLLSLSLYPTVVILATANLVAYAVYLLVLVAIVRAKLVIA